MLIEINSSIIESEDINNLSEEVVNALENLALARREGKHSVISDRETLSKLYQCPNLSKRAKDLYLYLFHHFTQFKIIRSTVKKYVEVTNINDAKLRTTLDQEIIQVPPSFFKDSTTIQKTILLCENLQDCFFYEYIAKVCKLWKNHKNIYLSCEYHGGGGSTISTEYTNIQSSNCARFCLCIVDSDRIAPNSSLGETARKLEREANEDCIFTHLLILELREIENLIPPIILSELCLNQTDRQKALKIVEDIIKTSNSDTKFYLDLKDGSYMEKIINCNYPQTKNFWSVKIKALSDIFNQVDSWCLSNWKCCNPNKCTCYISLGFGEKILSNIVDRLQNKVNTKLSEHSLSKSIDDLHRIEWEKVGQIVIDWCFAEPARRV